jgi:hypothetical protein
MLLSLTLLLLAAAGPVLGPQKTFGDWAVACDNVQRCEMTSLLPESAPDDAAWNDLRVSVVREPAGAPVLMIDLQGDHSGRAELRIDGNPAGGGMLDGGTLTIPGAAAVAAMASAKQFAVTNAAGKVIGRASLAGSSAALRFIDAAQGLAGTSAALVATGPKPRPATAPRPLPVVSYIRPPAGPAPTVTPALRKAMMTASKCEDEFTGADQAAESHRLDARTTLVLLPCGSGAYNANAVPFVVVAGKPTLARFDTSVGWSNDGPPMLVNADFDAKTARLGSYAKARGVGDCGSSQAFVWDGAMFRLVEATQMGECRGSTNWLTVWRAEARAR